MKKKIFLLAAMAMTLVAAQAQHLISNQPAAGYFTITGKDGSTAIYVDPTSPAVVKKAAQLLQEDIERVTSKKPALLTALPAAANNLIIIGTAGQSAIIDKLITAKKIQAGGLKNQWEAYQWQTAATPLPGINKALVITGSDRRGTAYGVLELSKQMGVSPWYWWADVPVQQQSQLYLTKTMLTVQSPAVKYRGIFINDEAPALSGWSKEKFGGFNHRLYEKVFELLLRLKANYLWPAMWGNAFYDDDSLNIKAAEEYAIVIGTSHHEPLMRAHDEWRRYGQGKWNYDSNEVRLKAFWRGGMQRATNEKIVSIGMRGDGDEPMSRETATALLERIVKDQREIIAEATHKPASETPQLWALYKEVQDYYDKGMRVPDDVTLLLCDDNWGNIRKLPKLNEQPRKGGYGIYYHFDYVGGPRNYKWVNTNPIARVWEQMHLAWEYKARQIWIVNVGDIKPMEFPISFFLDYAWNPAAIGANDLQRYTEQWCAQQFGSQYAVQIAAIISKYTKYNGRRKPELLDANTYSLQHYQEAERVTAAYNDLLAKAARINDQLPVQYRDAYFQLVLYPVKAGANLYSLYLAVANNKQYAAERQAIANQYADTAQQLYLKDSLISLQYHALGNGKWNHMMDQTHIGYTYWQQPPANRMPAVKYVPQDSILPESVLVDSSSLSAFHLLPQNSKNNVFFEQDGYISIEAAHFSRAVNTSNIRWKVLPDHGRTDDAVTPFPVTAPTQKPGGASPHLQYECYTYDAGPVSLQAYFSPTLNFHNSPEGLQYAISIDNETPQIISINKEDNHVRTWEKWVANNIIIKTSTHRIKKPGKHVIKYWMVNPAVVLQKLVANFGGLQETYLGPPETARPAGNVMMRQGGVSSLRMDTPTADATQQARGLKDYYSDYFPIGVAVSPRALKTDEAKLIVQQFNSLTPENAMKMGPIHPKETEYNWKDADSIIAFAQRHNLKVRGHTLCWHNQTPSWLFVDNNGSSVSKDVLLQRLKEHITTVVGRYKGKIYAWDVVNEAISDKPGEYLRPSKWWQIAGEEYIAKAFQWAHEADPNALLFYNDYDEISAVKRAKIIRLIKSLQAQGIPIHGVGLQGHWAINEPSREQLDSTLQQFAGLGLRLQITELDISVYPKEHVARERKPEDAQTAFTPEREQQQLEKYTTAFELFRKYRQHITGVTFWNISDRHSWLDNFPVRGRKDYPLLFDQQLQPKKAFQAVVNF